MTTLADYCGSKGFPYYELCKETPPYPIVRLEIASGDMANVGTPLTYCAYVEDATIFGHTYLRFFNTFITDHQGFQMEASKNGFEFYSAQSDGFTPTVSLEAEYIFLGGGWHDPDPSHGIPNFGHFMFEFMPRLAIFDRYNLLHLPMIVYNTIPERWLDFIRLAVPQVNFIRVDPTNPPIYKKVWVSSCPMQRSELNAINLWAPALHWVRNALVKNVDVRKVRKVYIGRKGAKWRKVSNEVEMLAILEAKGFVEMDPMNLSAAEQVQWMAEAETVVVANGAAPIITQFCPEHCRIISLHPDKIGSGYWGGLGHAISLRQRFERLQCKHIQTDQTRLNMFKMNEAVDYEVHLPSLEKLIA